MGMHHTAAGGYVIEVTEENIRKFKLEQVGEDFIALMNSSGIYEIYESQFDSDSSKDPLYGPLFDAFNGEYGIIPELLHIQDEADGCDNVQPNGYYFFFTEEDKYVKTIRPEWTNLPIEPQIASWCDYG